MKQFTDTDAVVNTFMNTSPASTPIFDSYLGANESGVVVDGSDYEWVHDSRGLGIYYLRFPQPDSLQARYDADISINVDDNKSGNTPGFAMRYAKMLRTADSVYLFAHDNNDGRAGIGATYVKAADAPEHWKDQPWRRILENVSDFCAFEDSAGVYIGTGHIGGVCFVFRSTSPGGQWENLGAMWEEYSPGLYNMPGWCPGQADHCSFKKNGKYYVLWQGIAYAHVGTPAVNHNAIQQFDPYATGRKAIGNAQEFVHSMDVPLLRPPVGSGGFNPVYTNKGGHEGYFLVGTYAEHPEDGWMSYAPLSTDTGRAARNPKDYVRVLAAHREDLSNNTLLRTYGNIGNDTGGIRAGGDSSGAWGFTNNMGLWQGFIIRCRVRIASLPVSGEAVVFHLRNDGTDASQKMELTVTPAGRLNYTYQGWGAATTIDIGPAGAGADVSLRIEHRGDYYIINRNEGSKIYAPDAYPVGISHYSLLNDGTDTAPPGRQLDGAIMRFSITSTN